MPVSLMVRTERWAIDAAGAAFAAAVAPALVERDGKLFVDQEHPAYQAAVAAREQAAEPPGLLRRLAGGVAGQVKARLGMDPAADGVVAGRLEICGRCEHRTAQWTCGRLLRGSGSPTCGCWLKQKVQLSRQQCPLGKW